MAFIRRRRCPAVVTALLALAVACRRSDVPRDPATARQDAGAPRTTAADAGPPGPTAVASRSCGEAGPTATPLPAALFDGMLSAGDTEVQPGQKRQAGGVEAHYDPNAWIGTREAGHRGAALRLLIDRAVVGPSEPWGAQVDLHPRLERRTFIGPYRIDVKASGEEPPLKVSVHVDRRACPDHAVVPPSPGPIWMWASTEAIRLFTIDLHGQMLQIGIAARPDGPRVEVSALGWRQSLFPRPGTVHRARIDGRVVIIDAVEPGQGTRFDGTGWHAIQGMPRASIRARVEPAPPLPAAAAPAPATPCGVNATVRTAMPAQLGKPPRAVAEVTIAAGETRRLAGIELTASAQEVPARHGRDQPERLLAISSPSLTPSGMMFGGPVADTGLARAERAMVQLEAVGPGSPPARVRARAFALSCPRSLALPLPGPAQYVWLSTVGHGRVTFGPPDQPALTLEVHPYYREVSLSASSANAYDSRRLDPAAVGHVATMDDLQIEITDVVVAPGTTPFPIAHVQVRISR